MPQRRWTPGERAVATAPGWVFKAKVKEGDEGKKFVHVIVDTGEAEIEFALFESLTNPGVLALEVDGDLDVTNLRINMNDNLVIDTVNSPLPIEDPRQ